MPLSDLRTFGQVHFVDEQSLDKLQQTYKPMVSKHVSHLFRLKLTLRLLSRFPPPSLQ